MLVDDTDIDSATLTAVLVASPANGNLTLNADGSFVYTPAADYNGPDSFTYKANDGSLDSNTAMVSITVTPVDDLTCSVVNLTTSTTSTDLAVAITAAAPGSELEITGLCIGNYTLGKNLTLTGVDTAGAKATLDGNASGSVVTVSGGVVASITNLHITNG